MENRKAIIEIKLNRKEYESLHPYNTPQNKVSYTG